MKDSNVIALPYEFSPDDGPESWFTKTCILEMFLSFHQSYGKSFSYRDFLMEVLLSYEKTYNSSYGGDVRYEDYKLDNQFDDKCFDEKCEEIEMIEEQQNELEYSLGQNEDFSEPPEVEEARLTGASVPIPCSNNVNTFGHDVSQDAFRTIKTEAVAVLKPQPEKHKAVSSNILHPGGHIQQPQFSAAIPAPNRLRSFTCKMCGRDFSRKEHLMRHERIHTDSRPFPCHYCPRRFRRQDCQRRHMRSYHPQLLPDPPTCSNSTTTVTNSKPVTLPSGTSYDSMVYKEFLHVDRLKSEAPTS